VNTEHAVIYVQLVVVLCRCDRPSADPTVVDAEFCGFEICWSAHNFN